jgi:hypothetical protein
LSGEALARPEAPVAVIIAASGRVVVEKGPGCIRGEKAQAWWPAVHRG